jgi:hypothetical protein
MSAQLGIGVHVATGWFPPQVQTVRSLLLRKGVIESGPYDRGFCYQSDGGRKRVLRRSWMVRLDDGVLIMAAEWALFPLDDGDPQAEPMRHEQEVEA